MQTVAQILVQIVLQIAMKIVIEIVLQKVMQRIVLLYENCSATDVKTERFMFFFFPRVSDILNVKVNISYFLIYLYTYAFLII